MIQKASISVYTPSMMDAETRERIFVQRHQLLRKVVRWCEESMLTGDKHHLLFVGPRGCGKTHFVSMVHDRVSENPELADRMRIAWLGEDSVFTGLIDLALEIADELAENYPEEFEFDYRGGARGLTPDDAAEQILGEVVKRLGDRSILLMMENLDRAMRGLGDLGQKKWRAFLQEQGRVATVATSQQLFEGVSSRDAAFYGFFEIVHLVPLSVEDARELMGKIARENDNCDLAEFLRTPEGRYRVRALWHLAGGNHRMYVVLSEFLTKESLDGLVACFEELADELTPYFQERVRSLSPQQGRIIQALCGADGAMTVKEVAEETFIGERNVSKHLGELKQKGYVVSEKRGKESYYDMAEPLMRLCLEVKKQRGEPLKLVASFLRAWYSEDLLREGLGGDVAMLPARCLEYKKSALESVNSLGQVLSQRLVDEFQSHMEKESYGDAMRIAEEAAYADRVIGPICKAQVLRRENRLAEALAEVEDVLALPSLNASQRNGALYYRSIVFSDLGQSKKAIEDYSTLIKSDGVPVSRRRVVLFARGVAYRSVGESDRAIADFSAVIDIESTPPELKAAALFARATTYREVGNLENAIADFSETLEMEEASVDQKGWALIIRADIYGELNEHEKAIGEYGAVLEMQEASAEMKAAALITRATHHTVLGEFKKAIADSSVVLEMKDAPVDQKLMALFERAASSIELGDFKSAIDDYSAAIEMREVPIDQKRTASLKRGAAFVGLGDWRKAIRDYSAVIETKEMPVDQRAMALLGRGIAYNMLEEFEKEIADYSALVEMEEAPQQQVANAMNLRGSAYWRLRQFDRSERDFKTVIGLTNIASYTKTYALFSIVEAIVPTRAIDESVECLRRAFEKGDPDTGVYGGSPEGILRTVLMREHQSWREFIDKLIPIYAEYDALDKLGSGLTESIAALDEGDYSESQLDLWNGSWQEFGGKHDELRIALEALDAAVEVIKSKDDRALFGLPLEIRKIVRPLLKKTLGRSRRVAMGRE